MFKHEQHNWGLIHSHDGAQLEMAKEELAGVHLAGTDHPIIRVLDDSAASTDDDDNNDDDGLMEVIPNSGGDGEGGGGYLFNVEMPWDSLQKRKKPTSLYGGGGDGGNDGDGDGDGNGGSGDGYGYD